MCARPFRFGVLLFDAPGRDQWVTTARRAEELGYDVLVVPDHLQDQLSPVPALQSAADVTSSLRIGSFVFLNDLRHPAVLARDVATLDVLSGGRFELGIGAGWARTDYDQTGLAFGDVDTRIARLTETIDILNRWFAEETVDYVGRHYQVRRLRALPRPVQRPRPPLFIGGGGRKILTLAARKADIVGLIARGRRDGSEMDWRDMTYGATAQKLSWIREAAGERFARLELNIYMLTVVLTTDARRDARREGERLGLSEDDVMASPHMLIGTRERLVERLLEQRERLGVSYVVVRVEAMETFAEVMALARSM